MSRNIGGTSCEICHGEVRLEETPRLITSDEAGCYWDEYRDRLTVARASCATCGAKYLAWAGYVWHGETYGPGEGRDFFDLSFRSSFNDEPGPEDLPPKDALQRLYRAQCLKEARRLAEEHHAATLRYLDRVRELLARDGESPWEAYRR